MSPELVQNKHSEYTLEDVDGISAITESIACRRQLRVFSVLTDHIKVQNIFQIIATIYRHAPFKQQARTNTAGNPKASPNV